MLPDVVADHDIKVTGEIRRTIRVGNHEIDPFVRPFRRSDRRDRAIQPGYFSRRESTLDLRGNVPQTTPQIQNPGACPNAARSFFQQMDGTAQAALVKGRHFTRAVQHVVGIVLAVLIPVLYFARSEEDRKSALMQGEFRRCRSAAPLLEWTSLIGCQRYASLRIVVLVLAHDRILRFDETSVV